MTLTPTLSAPSVVSVPLGGNIIEIEYQWINPELAGTDLLVFLHEGLGSISMWRGWPEQLCQKAQCRGLVFSRYGYGQSTPRFANDIRTPAYLDTEARLALPAFLNALGLEHERPVLYGHSDGGSIALIYASLYPDRVKAIAVAAPHIFVEDITLEGISQVREIAAATDLIPKLGRHHRDPASVFHSWNDTWLKPEFKAWNIEHLLAGIRCPVLAIQGVDDEYGTLEQIRGIQRLAAQTELCVIEHCGHSPHRDQPDAVNNAVISLLGNVRPD